MNEQTRYFGISAGLHGMLLIMVLFLTTTSVVRKDVVTIDFSLDNRTALFESEQVRQSRPATMNRPPALVEQPSQDLTQPTTPVPAVTSTLQTPEPAPQPITTAVQIPLGSANQRVEARAASGSTVSSVTYVHPATVPVANRNSAGESSVEQVKSRYLKEHFNYIRELIVKRLGYPHLARKMGWSGKVVLAFQVEEDGGVRSVHIRESSGYSVLDNSAVETVKTVAPFPRPPVAAEIVMPVLFRLQ